MFWRGFPLVSLRQTFGSGFSELEEDLHRAVSPRELILPLMAELINHFVKGRLPGVELILLDVRDRSANIDTAEKVKLPCIRPGSGQEFKNEQ